MTRLLEWTQLATAALWSQPTLYLLLGAGLLFTVWTRLGQFRILSHGYRVVRGQYDNPDDPGAINHFQALSAALSATIGLGNIGGVAIAIGLGGPGALFWMWVVGFFGIALKTVEITLTMLYRNVEDPDDPHGGPMWVIDRTLGRTPGPRRIAAKCLGGLFCLACIYFTVAGICLFQTWNVADMTNRYFGVPQVATGIVVAVLVGLVIIGGIRRIGHVAGKLVPVMTVLYLLSAVAVLAVHVERIPAMIATIFIGAFSPTESGGAFVGAGAWLAFTWGLKRAIYSNEAGLGSAAMAHAAARTDEPAREGIVGGLGPLIDTLIICTLTALVILITGAWNRPPQGTMQGEVALRQVDDHTRLVAPTDPAALPELPEWDSYTPKQQVFFVVSVPDESASRPDARRRVRVYGTLRAGEMGEVTEIDWQETIENQDGQQIPLPADSRWLADESGRPIKGVYREFTGAALTAHAFDRAFPGLGKWMLTLAVWLFAISTTITWSYYGEQSVIYLAGTRWVLPYKLAFLGLAAASTVVPMNNQQLDDVTSLGTGLMLWANMLIVLPLSYLAIRAYRDYFRRLDAGEFQRHAPDDITDLVEGREQSHRQDDD